MQEIVVIAQIIGLVVVFRCQHKAYRTRREVIELAPYTGTYVQPVIGTVERYDTPLAPIIEHDIETAAHCDEKLLQLFMGMAASLLPAGHIIEIIYAAHGKRQCYIIFHNRKVAVRTHVFGKCHHTAICCGISLRLVIAGLAVHGNIVHTLRCSRQHRIVSTTIPSPPSW